MAKFVYVYAKATGKKHKVPEHYLDNPVLMRPFSKTPKSRAAEQAAPAGSGTPPPPPPDSGSALAGPATPDTPAAGDKE